MNNNIFFAGSFFCAVAAFCVGQFDFLKSEAFYISGGLAIIGSVLLKFGLDALQSLQNRNMDLSVQFTDTISKKIDNIEQRLLQNNSERKENIYYLCQKADENQNQLLQSITVQKDILQSLNNSIINIETLLKLEQDEYKSTAIKTEQMREEIIVQLQKENEIISEWKNVNIKDRNTDLQQVISIGDCLGKQLKEVKNISADLANISDGLSDLANKTESCEKTIARQKNEISDFIKEVEELVGDLNEVLIQLQKEFVAQNEMNRTQISTYHERYASVSEKDIDIINKIYNGLKK